jgi:hypothetical protein
LGARRLSFVQVLALPLQLKSVERVCSQAKTQALILKNS